MKLQDILILAGVGIAAALLLTKRSTLGLGGWKSKWPFPVDVNTKIPFSWKVVRPEESQYPPELWAEEPLIPRPHEQESVIEYNPRMEELPLPPAGFHWEPLGVPLLHPGITRRWTPGMTGSGVWVPVRGLRVLDPELTEEVIGYPLRRDFFIRKTGPTII